MFTTAHAPSDTILRGWQATRTRLAMAAALLDVARRVYDSPLRALEALRGLRAEERAMLPEGRRLRLHRGRVYSRPAGPGFPSRAWERAVEVELNRALRYRPGFDLPIALLAVTRHCALHCAHCSEWNPLQQPDTLSVDALRAVADALRGRGVSHLELTGGEPLQRLDAVEAIARDAADTCDVWVLTSGAPMTEHNARRLADAGVTAKDIGAAFFANLLDMILRGDGTHQLLGILRL